VVATSNYWVFYQSWESLSAMVQRMKLPWRKQICELSNRRANDCRIGGIYFLREENKAFQQTDVPHVA
jgi:hypothetical protein